MEKILVEVLINRNIKEVWYHYTNSESIKKWYFASDDWECPDVTNNIEVGGRFLIRMQAKDKSFGFDFTGTYLEIETLKKIKYVMDKAPNEKVARECEITFEDLDKNTTKVIIVFDSEDENPLELQKSGWQSILNNFKKFAEA